MFWPAIMASTAAAQFTINFVVDQQEATAVLGAERLPAMYEALNRVKNFFETALVNSTAMLTVPLRWQPPDSPAALADSGAPATRLYSWQTVRSRLIEVASGAGESIEPQSELAVYEGMPSLSVPFVWASTDIEATPRSASQCLLTFAQAQQLLFNPTGPFGDELRVRFRPPNATIKYQFFKGELKAGHQRFDVTAVHEVLHLLGYNAAADNAIAPNYLFLLDAYRFADIRVPVSATAFLTVARELRPTVDASVATRLGAGYSNGAYRMSRGTRTGGDGAQASHFRSATRLTPPTPIGVMDPTIEGEPDHRITEVYLADLNVLDMLGWVLDPATVNRKIEAPIAPVPIKPAIGEPQRIGQITFEWEDTTTNSEYYSINVFAGDPIANPDLEPVVFDNLSTSPFTIPSAQALRPGTYTWELVGNLTSLGFYSAGYRQFTIVCAADITGVGGTYDNGSVSLPPDGQLTIEDFLSFLGAFGDATGCPGVAPCNPADITGVGATYQDRLVDTPPDGDITIDDFLNFLSSYGDSGACS